jgi:hypothetical protein
MDKLEKVLSKRYTGTIESAADIVSTFNLENHQYHLDVRTSQLYIHPLGLRFSVGDYYYVPVKSEKFEAIG